MEQTIHQSKLWVYTTAFVMSFNGGYINSICLLSILQNAVGYVTGNLTLAGKAFEQGQYVMFLQLFLLVMCFLLGSIISGLIIKGQNLQRDRRYQTSLIVQIICVIASIFLLKWHCFQVGYVLAITMGMQNAMTTHYGSALIRTTHMTGTTTDLGILMSRWIKGDDIEFWKMKLYVSLIVGFSFGAVMGASIYSVVYAGALVLSILIYIGMLLLRK